jgi:peptide/nickel transport system substrate-binding protein
MLPNLYGKRGAKTLLFLIGLVILAAIAIGSAAPTSVPQPAATSAPAATSVPLATTALTAASQPRSAPAASARDSCGTLKLLWWQAPTILNPHLAQGTKDYDASRMVYEPLAAYDPNGNPTVQYRLAEEVPTVANGDVSADGKTITWKLKKNVKWSDGTPFTADDVLFN